MFTLCSSVDAHVSQHAVSNMERNCPVNESESDSTDSKESVFSDRVSLCYLLPGSMAVNEGFLLDSAKD